MKASRSERFEVLAEDIERVVIATLGESAAEGEQQ